ncbi:hypothetical protein [Xanthomonas arboricola]|uniref:Uncharacterized protein n=1 Tax=Xanthomonas arboricola pv. guizotiae TaxID=487867 RepID=A0A2S6ZNW2_9XANT|nr:hypothetical protein [Xanthomonas arboricola]PPT93963.1 hypothetical protein XarbCFBP7409_20210 [Xanthomonas arboricola pv. guizotiae]PPU17963.1 hypothetical protein XarbCFBP7408_20750 [Xanthomonas arboricola pv. guizotiae]
MSSSDANDVAETVGAPLLTERKRLGITQVEMAKRCSVRMLEQELIAHAEAILGNAFPEADHRWIAGAARVQVLGDRAGLVEREKNACQAILSLFEFGHKIGRKKAKQAGGR